MSERYTFGVLFCGLGGLTRGFEDAGFEEAFALDYDAAACRDHGRICKREATQADLATMTPDELRALSPRRPDVLVSSPPCVAFSGCLPQAQSVTPEYQAISSLAFRGIWLALEAWADSPPPLVIIENVPRINSRGRAWLDDLAALFAAYGYRWEETTHDCGELGGLLLTPGACALVVTRVRVKIPAHLSIQVDGRSSIGRLFLTTHQTAGWCDAGFGEQVDGGSPIVLELVNHSPNTIRLLDGARIGQLKVVRLSTPADRPYGSPGLGSHYADQQDVRPPAQIGIGEGG